MTSMRLGKAITGYLQEVAMRGLQCSILYRAISLIQDIKTSCLLSMLHSATYPGSHIVLFGSLNLSRGDDMVCGLGKILAASPRDP